jgi:hypothetical protein
MALEIALTACFVAQYILPFSNVRFKGDHNRAEKVYLGYKALQADDIADIIEFVINRPSHVNIADILVSPQTQASSSIIDKN